MRRSHFILFFLPVQPKLSLTLWEKSIGLAVSREQGVSLRLNKEKKTIKGQKRCSSPLCSQPKTEEPSFSQVFGAVRHSRQVARVNRFFFFGWDSKKRW